MGFASHTSDPPNAHSKGVSELLAYYVAFPVIGGLVSSVLSVVVPGNAAYSAAHTLYHGCCESTWGGRNALDSLANSECAAIGN